MMWRLYPLALLATLAAVQARAAVPDALSADVPSAGLTHLSFVAGSGEVKVTASADEAVHVRLDLEQRQKSFLWLFRWMSDSTAHDLAGARLNQERSGDGLSVSLIYPSDESHSDVKQRWTIALPARFAVNAAMGAGHLVIRDVSGGVTARLETGDLTIHVPGGPLKASTGVGRVHAITDSAQPGRVSVKSSFGLAALSFNGKLYAPPPSAFHFIGNSELQQATGKDDVELRVTVGEADLRVGPVGNDKGYQGLFDDDDK
ncbi:MAG TPA: hypothetical protein VLG68_07210 [Gammaproteobacteria bacterium]|nr:hypothetical protein [Gammaproteobacteria bacterium]